MQTAEKVVITTDQAFEPIRRSVFKRFPIVFTLLGTFGVGATFYGIERILASIVWLNERPWVILGIGLSVLALIGSLYKKLG
jgi:uncharacterized integral membrane protein